tara:strand:- start:656 stop:1141 length:486 start_codon:yes stop_codon:yes gene_type:complete
MNKYKIYLSIFNNYIGNSIYLAKYIYLLVFIFSSIGNNSYAEIVTSENSQRYKDSKLLIESDSQFYDSEKNIFNAKGNVLIHYYPKDIIAKSSFATFINNSGVIELFGKVFVKSLNGNNSLTANKFIYNTFQDYFYASSDQNSQVHLKILVEPEEEDLFLP